jgi:threonine dehydrogenase-like Zn-dependent dehydrogenase
MFFDGTRGGARLRVPLPGPRGGVRERGNHFRPGELPLFEMYLNGVNLRIARDNVRANIPPALDLAQSGRVDPCKVVSHVLDWETLPEELPKLHTKPVFVRAPVAAA